MPKWGRRKSWVVPVQAIVGVGLYLIGRNVEGWLAAETIDVRWITFMFGSLIFAAATQGEQVRLQIVIKLGSSAQG